MTIGDVIRHRATGGYARIVDGFYRDGRQWFLVVWDSGGFSNVEPRLIDRWFVLDAERSFAAPRPKRVFRGRGTTWGPK